MCWCVCERNGCVFLYSSHMFSKLHQFMSIWNECVYTIWHVNSCKKWTNAFTSLFIYFPFYDIAISSESAHIILVLFGFLPRCHSLEIQHGAFSHSGSGFVCLPGHNAHIAYRIYLNGNHSFVTEFQYKPKWQQQLRITATVETHTHTEAVEEGKKRSKPFEWRRKKT